MLLRTEAITFIKETKAFPDVITGIWSNLVMMRGLGPRCPGSNPGIPTELETRSVIQELCGPGLNTSQPQLDWVHVRNASTTLHFASVSEQLDRSQAFCQVIQASPFFEKWTGIGSLKVATSLEISFWSVFMFFSFWIIHVLVWLLPEFGFCGTCQKSTRINISRVDSWAHKKHQL